MMADRAAHDEENLKALEVLRDRLTRERDDSKGASAAALTIAIRALDSYIDILDSLIGHEQGIPPKVAGRDMDTYDHRREFVNGMGRSDVRPEPIPEKPL